MTVSTLKRLLRMCEESSSHMSVERLSDSRLHLLIQHDRLVGKKYMKVPIIDSPLQPTSQERNFREPEREESIEAGHFIEQLPRMCDESSFHISGISVIESNKAWCK